MKIMVADDEPIERMVVSKKIRKYFGDQVTVLEAENGREAISLYEQEKYQIALLDIQMPGIDGLEAAQKIRQIGGKCEIIFLTAFDEFSYAKKAINVRALDYLLKPVVDEELVSCLEEACRILTDFAKDGHELVKSEKQAEYEQEENVENIKIHKIKQKILDYIEKNYVQDISLQDVSNYMNYSDAYFCKMFKQCFEKNFIIFLTEFRIEKAKELLTNVSVNVKDVSSKVGFRDSNYFAKVFKRFTGVTPTEYRSQHL